MSEQNNARLKCLGAFLPVRDWEVVDTKQKIWKGVPLLQWGMRDNPAPFVFFSREYLPDANDMDKVFHEYEIKNESILGCQVLLVPKEKLLFAYEPGSALIKIAKPIIKFPLPKQ